MRSSRSFGFRIPITLAVLGALALACSAKAPLVAQGGECQLATDCQDGLICVPQKTGSNACPCVCVNSPATVQQLPPAADAGGKPAANPDAAAVADSASPPPLQDAATGGDASAAGD